MDEGDWWWMFWFLVLVFFDDVVCEIDVEIEEGGVKVIVDEKSVFYFVGFVFDFVDIL